MTYLLAILVVSFAHAESSAEKQFRELHQCFNTINSQYKSDFVGPMTPNFRQVGRFTSAAFDGFDYVIRSGNRLTYVRFQDVKQGEVKKDMFDVIQAPAPAEAGNRYTMVQQDMPGTAHAGDVRGCLFKFDPNEGLQNSYPVAFPVLVKYEDCDEIDGNEVPIESEKHRLDQELVSVIENAIAEQFSSVTEEQFQNRLSPNAKLMPATMANTFNRRYLGLFEANCGGVPSEVVRKAFSKYKKKMATIFPPPEQQEELSPAKGKGVQ